MYIIFPIGGGEGGAPAQGPGGGNRLGWGHLKRLYKGPTDYTKPHKDYTKTENIRQNPHMLDKDLTYLTRVATHNNLTHNTAHQTLKMTCIN